MNEDDSIFLNTADAIGARVCGDAIWSGNRCAWFGDRQGRTPSGGATIHSRTLGPQFYSGVSGVGYFLTHLAEVTGERIFRRTAMGAMLQTSALLDREQPGQIGFYSGSLGAAWALLECGRVLDAPEFRERGQETLRALRVNPAEVSNPDVIAGHAGAIPALLAMARWEEQANALEWAVELGDQLIQRARRADCGWCWTTVGSDESPGLTGFAHGASGFSLAFARLFEDTGEGRFREAAIEAMRYETHWRRSRERNWPDLRGASAGISPESDNLKFMKAWCHGAPGIALARLGVHRAVGDSASLEDAEIALESTDENAREFLEQGRGNVSLCHGAGGNADILLAAGRALNRNNLVERAREIGREGIRRFGDNRAAWPCGFRGEGYSPNLMIGLSGIGCFYLRLSAPDRIPSVLTPGGDAPGASKGDGKPPS